MKKFLKRYWYMIPFLLLAMIATQRRSWKAGVMTVGWFATVIVPKEVKEIKKEQSIKALEQRKLIVKKFKYP
jgi:hypothetical protein